MLALLPIEGRELCPGEPRLDGGLEGRLLLQPYRESELVDLTLAIVAINGWNRLCIAFRSVPGTYQLPAQRHQPPSGE